MLKIRLSRAIFIQAATASALLSLSATSSARAQPMPSFEVGTGPVHADPLSGRPLAFEGGVTGLIDLVYSKPVGHRPLRLDLYRPNTATAGARLPLIVFAHGGGWRSGHRRHVGAITHFPKLLAGMAARGFVVASIEYRLSGEAAFPTPLEDVRSAIRYLRRRAAEHGIDPTRVGIWGASAGGQLAQLAALACNSQELATKESQADPCVQAAVSWYGVSNFRLLRADRKVGAPNAEADYFGCGVVACPEYLLIAASPVTYADRRDPPMLLIHGIADRTVAASHSRQLAERLTQVGATVELLLLPGIDHAFIGATPEATRAATVKAVEATVNFFDRTLKVSTQ